jgi:hypothetical protein
MLVSPEEFFAVGKESYRRGGIDVIESLIESVEKGKAERPEFAPIADPMLQILRGALPVWDRIVAEKVLE